MDSVEFYNFLKFQPVIIKLNVAYIIHFYLNSVLVLAI